MRCAPAIGASTPWAMEDLSRLSFSVQHQGESSGEEELPRNCIWALYSLWPPR